jgi:hypothetical protein
MKPFFPFLAVLLAGCSYAVNPHVAGTLLESGKIAPCHGNHTDAEACGNAIFNAKVINQVQPGQTKQEVRTIMQHDPERRELAANTETWIYITDYSAELMTAITFTDGKVTSLKQVPWKAN